MLDYSPERGAQLYDQLLTRARAIPGVEAASVAKVVPLALDFDGGRRRMQPSAYEPRRGEDMEVHFNMVGAGLPVHARHPAAEGPRVHRGRSAPEATR